MKTPGWVLPVIVISQFFCTSLWFAGNAIMPDIVRNFSLAPGFLAYLTIAVQLGFIAGTFVFALFAVSDRFAPSAVFFVSALLAGTVNLGMTLPGIGTSGLLLFRFATGFFIAGIYPVGMKIASDYYQKGLGKSLGFLVGALLVLGTAFPHLLKSMTMNFSWKYVAFLTSALSAAGGICVLLFSRMALSGGRRKIKIIGICERVRTSKLPCSVIRVFWAYVGVVHFLGICSRYAHRV